MEQTLSWRTPYLIKTSQLICSANQWTGVSMAGTSVMEELIRKWFCWSLREKCPAQHKVSIKYFFSKCDPSVKPQFFTVRIQSLFCSAFAHIWSEYEIYSRSMGKHILEKYQHLDIFHAMKSNGGKSINRYFNIVFQEVASWVQHSVALGVLCCQKLSNRIRTFSLKTNSSLKPTRISTRSFFAKIVNYFRKKKLCRTYLIKNHHRRYSAAF